MTPSNSSAMKLVVSRLTEDSFVPGRREFLMFRDLGVANASSDRYGAVVMNQIGGHVIPLDAPTWSFDGRAGAAQAAP